MSSSVPAFLASRWEALELDRHGPSERYATVVVTPREDTSSCVVLVLIDRPSGRPSLVAKISRLEEDSAALAAEAAVLEFLQRATTGGLESVPRLVSFTRGGGHSLLVETALVGRHLDPHALRAAPERAVADVLEWLERLPRSPGRPGDEPVERLLVRPLGALRERLSPTGPEVALIDRTLELVEPLAAASLPLFAEHGDLSHPNVLRLEEGGIGAVDWELGEPRGLPLHDVFFFLAYAAWARRGARTVPEQVATFEEAFLRPGGWARPLAVACAQRADVDVSLLGPLFVACWARYTLRLAERLAGVVADGRGAGCTGLWRQRYAAYWHRAIARTHEVDWAA